MENKRKYIRLSCNEAYSLDFMIDENANKIIDLSEKGLRYQPSLDSVIELYQPVRGKITMKSTNRPYILSGNVARIENNADSRQVAIIFNKELQLPRLHILREYHYAFKARSN